ncbi:MAG: hypothetical protein ICV83_35580 [Cytophagales bacterium]|nr:hypothetical protein [Cytophagales bacterium]
MAAHPFRHSGLLRTVCFVQGLYFAFTGIWPLLDMKSFMAVTGFKVDLWLVKTVGVLIGVVGLVLLSAARSRRISPEILGLAVGCALGLTAIDVYYVFIDRIRDVYLLDALAEVALVVAWMVAWFSAKRA